MYFAVTSHVPFLSTTFDFCAPGALVTTSCIALTMLYLIFLYLQLDYKLQVPTIVISKW